MVHMRRLDVLARQLTAAAPPPAETLQTPPERFQTPALKHAIIVGGAVLDAQAKADVDIQAGSSVPGKVTHTPGGVARNIAACLCQLLPTSHPPPLFCTVLGKDVSGAALMASLQQMRLDTSHVRLVQGASTPTVLAILDRSGELVSCVADVQSVEEHLTPAEGLDSLARDALPQASLLVCEANLSPASLQFLCAAARANGVPIILEPVSVPKSKRAVGCLPYLTFITPNAMELVSIAEEVCKQSNTPFVLGPLLSAVQQHAIHGSNEDCSSLGDSHNSSRSNGDVLQHLLEELAHCASVLLRAGTQHILVTLGSRGAAIFSCPLRLRGNRHSKSSLKESHEGTRREEGLKVECVHMPALPPSGPVVSTSGAGDTLVGGLAAALLAEGHAFHKPAHGAASETVASTAPHASASSGDLKARSAMHEQQQQQQGSLFVDTTLHTSTMVQQQQQQQQRALVMNSVLHPSTMQAVALGMAAATAAIQSPSNVPMGLSMRKLTASASGLVNGQASVHRFRCWT